MMGTDDICKMGRSSAAFGSDAALEAEYAPLLITFVLSREDGARRVRCRGCREILPPSGSAPEHIRGTVELDGQSVPIVDANVWVHAEQTRIDPDTCILIADHRWNSERFHGGVLIPDIEQVMQLAAGSFDSTGRAQAGVNMRLLLAIDEGCPAHLVEACEEPERCSDEWSQLLGRTFCREACA